MTIDCTNTENSKKYVFKASLKVWLLIVFVVAVLVCVPLVVWYLFVPESGLTKINVIMLVTNIFFIIFWGSLYILFKRGGHLLVSSVKIDDIHLTFEFENKTQKTKSFSQIKRITIKQNIIVFKFKKSIAFNYVIDTSNVNQEEFEHTFRQWLAKK